jgi:phosphoenolpyruvate synthase/pyruvate phosphate dikinase
LRPGEPAAGAGPGIVWLGEPPGFDPAVVGEEFACLSALAGQSSVQPGFSLTAPPFEVDNAGELQPDVAALARAYRRLSGGHRPDLPVVIRGRLTGTGPPPLSWVPAPWTFFNVARIEAVTDATVECLAPYASSRARSFRSAVQGPAVAMRRAPMTWQGPASEATMAVQVQPFVPAEVCATVTSRASADAAGERDTLLIQARWGLPEDSARAGGWDLITLRRSDLAVTSRRTEPKNQMWVADAGGVIEVDVPVPLRTSACLTDDQARRIGELSLTAESRLSSPVEAEIMLAAGRLVLAWCRRQQASDQPPTGSPPSCEQGPS